MNLVGSVPAALAGLVLFFVPGFTLLALLPRREREALDFAEALFLGVATSVAASAWIGLVLAEGGRFSLTGAAVLLAGASAVALVLGRRRLGSPLPPLGRVADLLPALAVLAVSLTLHARPTEYLVGGRDPGTYVAAMALIARTGGVAYTDPAVLSIPAEGVGLFYRNPENLDFTWGRFMGFPLENPRTGRVFPEFFHLLPAFGAYLFQAMGVKGALATPPIFGVLGTLAVFFTLRRVFSAPVALLGGLLLAVNVVQVWFARYPVSEPMSQFLLFFGFLAVAHWEARGAAVFGALAGAALGLSLLVRVDSVLLLGPLAVYVLVRRVQHDLPWRQAAALLVPFGLLGLHAALHGAFWSRKYLLSIANRPYWHQPPWVWGLALLAALAAAVAVHAFAPRLRAVLLGRAALVRRTVMAALALLALYAAFVRPTLSAWAGADGNAAARSWTSFARLDADGDGRLDEGELAGRAGAVEPLWARDGDGDGALTRDEWKGDPPWPLGALGFQRLAAHDAQAFVRLGWFVTPLGLALAMGGVLLMLHEWRPRYLLLFLTALVFALFFFYKARVWHDYYFAMRRFVPVVLPLLLGAAAFLLVRLGRRGGLRRAAAGVLALVLLGAYVRDTWPLVRYTDWKGAVRFVEDVARHFGPHDVVISEQPRSIHLLSLPLWAVHGVNVLELARFNPDPRKLARVVESWRDRYRNVYFLHTYSTDLCGLFLEHVQSRSFGTLEWERAYAGKPRRPEARALHFRVSRVVPPQELQVPALREVDVGGSDDVQVSGFHDKEGGGEHTYRWTGSCASLYMPGLRPPAERLVVTASAGRRPADPPAVVRVSLAGVPVGSFTAGREFEEHVLTLPTKLPEGAPVLRFDVAGWRPSNTLPGSDDTRDLGVMLDRVRVLP